MRKRRDRNVRPANPPPAEPPPAPPTGDASGFHNVVDWVMATLLLGAAGAIIWEFEIAWNFDFDSPKFSPAVFVPIFLGGYGLHHLIKALRATLRARKFGDSTLAIHSGEVRMRATLRGVIRTAGPIRPLSDYLIRLQCIETFAMSQGSGETNRSVDRVRWEASTRVPPASVNSMEGIPFEFTLPAPFEKPEPAESGSIQTSAVVNISIPGLQNLFAHNRSPDATRWIVTIDAPLAGLDYHAFFGVIVKDSTREARSDIVLVDS